METYKSKYTGEEVDNSVGIRTLISKTAPTNRTQGNVGQFLFDSVTEITYQCKAVALDTDGTKLYTWKNIMENVGAGDMTKSVYDPANKARDIFKDIGDLTILKTTEKGSTVGAINEVNASLTTEIADRKATVWNPNIGINCDFRKDCIVNQRDNVSINIGTTQTYFLDCWYGYGIQGSIADNGLTIASDGTSSSSWIQQKIENTKDLIGKELTLSVETPDGIFSGSATIPTVINTSSSFIDLTSGIKGRLTNFGGNYISFVIFFSTTTPITIKRCKLELGSISTLHLDPPPKPQAGLAECQRYLVQFNPYGSAYAYFGEAYAISTTEAVVLLSLPVVMRSNVRTMIFSGSLSLHEINVGSINISNVIIGEGYVQSGNMVKFSVIANGLTVGKRYYFVGNGNNPSLLVSSEL